MYAIEILERNINLDSYSSLGYFIGTYTLKIPSEGTGKFLATCKLDSELDKTNIYKIKLFESETDEKLEKELELIEQTKENNRYLNTYFYNIKMITKLELEMIQEAKEKHKKEKTRRKKANREVRYTGISKNYLEEKLVLERQEYLKLKLSGNYNFNALKLKKQLGRIEMLEELINILD